MPQNLIEKNNPQWVSATAPSLGDYLRSADISGDFSHLAERDAWLRLLIKNVCDQQSIVLSDTETTGLLSALDARYFKNSQLGEQATDAEVAAAIVAHLAASDPHPQYVTDAEAKTIAWGEGQTSAPWVSQADLQKQNYISATTTGTAPTYVAAITPTPTLAAGLRLRIKFHSATSAASTLNLNATGAKSIKQYDTTGTKIPAVIAANMLTDVEYDGTDWVLLNPIESSGALLNIRIFTSSGTYTPTAGTKSIIVECVGGGGGGGGTYNTLASQFAVAGGGGAGGYGKSRYTSNFDSVVVTIGAGGVGGAANAATPGGNGGTTSFGSLMSCGGGLGGTFCSNWAMPVHTSGAPSGDVVGANIQSFSPPSGTAGYSASNGWLSGSGASSFFGRGGVQVGGTSIGSVAIGYGAGGGGASTQPSSTGQVGGAGTAGVIIVWEYAA